MDTNPLHVPIVSFVTFGGRCFLVVDPTEWNKLPLHALHLAIRNSPSVESYSYHMTGAGKYRLVNGSDK